MSALWTVPEKLIVRQFYLQNTGLFLVVLMLGFGFLSSTEHIALATYALTDWSFLGAYVVLWVLYTIHSLRFSLQVVQKTDLLQLFRLIPPGKRVVLLYFLHLQLLAPVIGYAGFMIWVGNQQNATAANTGLVVIVSLLSLLPLPFVERALRNPNPEQFSGNISAWLRQRFATPYGLFFIRYLFREQPATLLLTKIGSCLGILGVLALYPTDDYDIRLLSLGMLLSAALQAGIVFELYQFEANQLLLLRNLPVSIGNRLLGYLKIIALLISPEAVLLIKNHPADVSIPATLFVWLFGLGLVALQYATLLARHRSRDRFMSLLFWPIIGCFLLIMYRLPVWALALAGLAAATLLFIRTYYRSSWEE
ncbi:hypothetical protein GCM10028803_58720 [Larkinella knui]|uniref:Uncharacterized protein n=1 Tax=Larkinella knui TaxID=2025310 RepID=A0A3P1CAZ8_9BACT|nr:hypothetical protein [Larkinella knui]RRB10236.1 hypothetical protein EHT87_28765 [Larkinella knui]